MSSAWLQNAVIYHILIDRFAGCDPQRRDYDDFCGGTLSGVRSKLDYLTSLGVDALWLSPFCRTVSYHGYAVTDFMSVEPRFGAMEDLKGLIDDAHSRGIRVIADFVCNHCSSQHPFFIEAQRDKQSQYNPWFTFKRWPGEYLSFLHHKDLPKLNLAHPPAQEHILEAALQWLRLGVDGFRLDHVVGVKHSFWQLFRRRIKKDFPDAALIGEAWLDWVAKGDLRTIHLRHKLLHYLFGSPPEAIYREYLGELDGVLDFAVHKLICRCIADRAAPPDSGALALALHSHYAQFPEGFLLPTFLDNHDMDRFLFVCGNDKERLKLAAQTIFALSQAVVLYYGTEAGMSQAHSVHFGSVSAHGVARQPMPWGKLDADLFDFFRELIAQKKGRRKGARSSAALRQT
jgi:glycosidase